METVDRIGLGDLGQRLAGRPALQGFLPLAVAQLALAAELDAIRLRPPPARALIKGGAMGDRALVESHYIVRRPAPFAAKSPPPQPGCVIWLGFPALGT
jgi:hypothetical protein